MKGIIFKPFIYESLTVGEHYFHLYSMKDKVICQWKYFQLSLFLLISSMYPAVMIPAGNATIAIPNMADNIVIMISILLE